MEVTKDIAIKSMAWSAVQVWGAKFATLALFFGVARLLDPHAFGVVSASVLVLYLISLVSDFGFGDAIIQRRELASRDVTFPFVVSLGGALLLATLAWVFSDRIARLMGVPDMAGVLRVMCPIAPLTSFLLFQEAMYKRQLQFKTLALRSIAANLLGGAVAIGAALAGAGVWTLVLQAYVVLAVSIAWLWINPCWRPELRFDRSTFRELASFGSNVVSARALDFVITRSIEFLIGMKFGPVALGLYAVSSRLYYTLLELLQGWLSGVSLSVLSRFESDRERLMPIYRASITLLAAFGMATFWALSSVADELIHVLAGSQWSGAGELLRLLLLLGGVQCIQFINSTYLSALGKPQFAVVLNLVKLLCLTLALAFLEIETPEQMVRLYVLAQLAATPLSFAWISRSLRLPKREILSDIAVPVIACACGLGATLATRSIVLDLFTHPLARGVALLAIFLMVHTMLLSADALVRRGSSMARVVSSLIKLRGAKL